MLWFVAEPFIFSCLHEILLLETPAIRRGAPSGFLQFSLSLMLETFFHFSMEKGSIPFFP